MSDIVERLRSGQMWERASQNEAAAEIERLRALIDELYGWVSMENRGRALAVVKEALERKP